MPLTTKLGTQVVLRWVKGHAGFFGNETADRAAAAKAGDLVLRKQIHLNHLKLYSIQR